jgi:hypothetical protein
VILVRTDVSRETNASIIKVTRLGELDDGGDTFHRNVGSYKSHTA